MSTSYVSRKLKTYSAKDFRDSFDYSNTNDAVGYVFIGKTTPFVSDPTPDNISNSVADEKKSWDTMLAAKKISPGSVELVIPVQRWTANTRYKQYDDQATLDDLLSISQDGATTVYPMYVINSENNVYKCICNNLNSISTVEPTGNYSENEGFIQTEVGGSTCYIWKYMFNIRDANKFFTDEWMPVPFPTPNSSSNDYELNSANLVDGALAKIKVTNSGSGYVDTVLNVATFAANTTVLVAIDSLVDSNVKANMSLTGQGMYPGTYITNVFPANNRITLSQATIDSGGGTANTLNVLTRVEITGDGFGTTTTVRINPANGAITKIDVPSFGRGYTRANVKIYGTGTGATARAILPPKFGHGYNPAIELGANNIMIVQRIGEVDATEGGLISTNTSIRQYGVVLNPYKYDDTVPVTKNTANSVISQVMVVSLLSGAAYTPNEFVYQGTSANTATFSGYVVSQTSNTVSLIEVFGTPQIGSIMTGENSSTLRAVSDFKNPDFKRYSGDILYAQNITEVQRSDGQAEEIKLVFKF